MKKEKLSGKIEKTGTEKKRGTSFKVWLSASRPKTLPASIVPVIMGTVMAYSSRRHHFLSAVLALICAVLIQVVTNFVNDYSDFKKGTDSPDRIGPLRVTQAGLVTPGQMLRAIASVIFIVFPVPSPTLQTANSPSDVCQPFPAPRKISTCSKA